MRNQIKYTLYLICLGASLIAYAHSTFSTKDTVNTLHQDVREIRQDVKYIREKIIEYR